MDSGELGEQDDVRSRLRIQQYWDVGESLDLHNSQSVCQVRKNISIHSLSYLDSL